MANFNTSNVGLPGGCGVNSLPAYGTYNLSAACPNDGFGTSSFPVQTQPVQFVLNKSVPKVTFGTSAAARNIIFGQALTEGSRCYDFVTSVTGLDTLTDAFDGASTANPAANAFFCFIDHQEASVGFIARVSSGDISSLSGVQVIGNPCSPCYSSDVQFQGVGGCSGQCDFAASNILVGDSNFFILNLPANVGLTIDICSCIVETPSFSGCPTGTPSVAQVPAGTYCAPNGRGF